MKTLLFLHGFLGSHDDWKEMSDHFPTFRCHSLTIPIHLTFENALSEIKKEIENLNLPPCPLIGYSLGGRMALRLSLAYPGLFSHSIFMSTHPGLEEKDKKKRIKKDERWAKLLEREGIEPFLKKWYAQPLFSKLKLDRAFLERRKKCSPDALCNVLRNWSPGKISGVWDRLSLLSKKALFIFGKEDLQYHSVYHRIFDFEEMSLEWIEGSSHAVHIEQPQRCADVIKQFIQARDSMANLS